MPGFLNSLFGRGSDLYPFEISALEEVIAHLDRESGSQLRKQFEAINTVQRIAEGKEVNLYKMSRGKPVFDDDLRFAGTGDEVLLAAVSIAGPIGGQSKLKIEFWLAKGRLFSLVFNKPPKEFFGRGQLKAVQPRILDTKIYFDPAQPQEVSGAPTGISLSGWLRDWQKKQKISELNIPLSTQKRMEELARIDAVLPLDYLEMLSQTDGAKIGNCVILGTTKIRKVVSTDENYYIIADAGSHGGLVVKEGGQDGELYALDYEDDSLRSIGKSLKNAVENALGMPSGDQ